MRGLNAVCTSHFNIFNHSENSFFTPGAQLANIARVKPDAPAIIYVSPKNTESVMTWRTLETLSNRIAWYLLEQGIGAGKSVIVALPNIPTHIALAFGIWKAGACYVPISDRVPRRNLLEICECVSPSLVVTNRWKPADYPALSSNELKELSRTYSEEMPPDVLAVPNLANCTGGTTGKTKVVQQDMPAGESDEGLQTWFTLYMPSCLDAKSIVALIKRYQIEYVQLVPTLMQRIIKLPNFHPEDLSSLKVLCHTGGVCSADLKREWFRIISRRMAHSRRQHWQNALRQYLDP